MWGIKQRGVSSVRPSVCLRLHLPTIFHTASIWLTVLLAVQRYVSVCHSTSAAARRFRTVDNAVRAIIGVMLAAVMVSLLRCQWLRDTTPSLKPQPPSP